MSSRPSVFLWMQYFFYGCASSSVPLWDPTRLSGEEPAGQCRRPRRCRFNLWVRKIPWRKKWQPTPVFFPGKLHGQRSLAVVPTSSQDEALAHYSVSREVPCSALKGETVPDTLRDAHGDLTSLAPHERLPEILVVPREKTPTGAAARGKP